MQRIVRRCLAKDRDERYQTIKDVALELKEIRHDLQSSAVVITPSRAQAHIVSTESAATVLASQPLDTARASPITQVSSANHVLRRLGQSKVAIAAGLVALILIGFGAAALVSYLRASESAASIDSIAVLPFVVQNPGPNADWVSDGLTESIINSLTQVPNLKVIARSSVFRYKGNQIDPRMPCLRFTAAGCLSSGCPRRRRRKRRWRWMIILPKVTPRWAKLWPYIVASIYARLGRNDEAFAWLEKGLQQRDFRVILVKVSFEFDSLHSDPRYAEFLKRIGSN